MAEHEDAENSALNGGGCAGESIAGYRLERPLGQGGMANVWLGRSANGSLAAIKLLRESSAKVTKDLFEREKRVLLRLQHPNLVPVFEVGDDFIVSGYIEGVDLQQRMRTPISVGDAVNIACEIASALAVVHLAGVVHCDVKPANILLAHDGTPFLADFGIASLEEDALASEFVHGTVAYMAPEQRRGESTAKSDQYGLAKTLLAMLGGATHIPAEQAIRTLPDTVQALKPVLSRALAKRPDERFTDVSEFSRELRTLAIDEAVTVTRLAPRLRNTTNFRWVTGHHRTQKFGEHIVRLDYRLSNLERDGLLSAERIAAFREVTGCEDFGWSMYARPERLGPLNEALALARAKQNVVFLHGLFVDREVWSDVAVGIARNNGGAVALTPDMPGFGESTLGANLPPGTLSPKGIVRSMKAWLRLLALTDTQTAIVGHSYSAASLMCASEVELGVRAHTICVTPTFLYYTWRLRLKARLDSIMTTLLFALPGPLARRIARFAFRRDPSLARVSDATAYAMASSALRLGGRRAGKLFWAIAKALPAPAHELTRCTVVTTPDDPLVSIEVAQKSIESVGIPDSQWYRLVYGGHFPQLIDEHRPGWGMRNVHELVSLVDGVLEKARFTKRTANAAPSVDTGAKKTAAEGVAEEAAADAATVEIS